MPYIRYVNLNSSILTFRWCAPGKIILSKRNAKDYIYEVSPEFEITFTQGFWVSETPVTIKQWHSIMQTFEGLEVNTENEPISEVSYYDCLDFIRKINLFCVKKGFMENGEKIDIPNFAQWEYACMANAKTKWFFGDKDDDLTQYGWIRHNSNNKKHAVALLKSNAWGFFDLYGNVMELCYEILIKDNSLKQYRIIDPQSRYPDSVIYTRGGSYEDGFQECQPAYGQIIPLDNPYNEPTGLRLIITH
jgi:formylglycine-generating enzyme required for sulfatase activity